MARARHRILARPERPQLSPLHRPPAWVADYLPIPWLEKGRSRTGVDCWGVLYLGLKEQFDIEIPRYEEMTWRAGGSLEARAAERQRLAEFMSAEDRMAPWRRLWDAATSPMTEPIGGPDAQPGDGLLMRMVTSNIHVGLVVAPGWMLHIEEPSAGALARNELSYVTCEPYDDMRNANCIVGRYRWAR